MLKDTAFSPINFPLVASVVVPSLRPTSGLLRLLESLETQTFDFRQIVIVDQSDGLDSLKIISNYKGRLKNCIEVVRSQPGLSKARNAGLRCLHSGWDVVLLPDDDVWLASDAGCAIADALSRGMTAGSGRLRPESSDKGNRIAFPDAQTDITRDNVWRTSIEACYFLTPSFVSTVGLYDEDLGIGSPSPWQSGEGTDLLLRGLTLGHAIAFIPGYELVEGDGPQLDRAVRRTRLRKYARGTGRVYARNYPRQKCVMLVARSLSRLVIQSMGGSEALGDNWQILLGRVEGLAGRVL